MFVSSCLFTFLNAFLLFLASVDCESRERLSMSEYEVKMFGIRVKLEESNCPCLVMLSAGLNSSGCPFSNDESTSSHHILTVL